MEVEEDDIEEDIQNEANDDDAMDDDDNDTENDVDQDKENSSIADKTPDDQNLESTNANGQDDVEESNHMPSTNKSTKSILPRHSNDMIDDADGLTYASEDLSNDHKTPALSKTYSRRKVIVNDDEIEHGAMDQADKVRFN